MFDIVLGESGVATPGSFLTSLRYGWLSQASRMRGEPSVTSSPASSRIFLYLSSIPWHSGLMKVTYSSGDPL